jgi:hypothetical protein
MNASVLIHAFGTQAKLDKPDVLASLLRIWISTLYPFDAEAAIRRADSDDEPEP